MWHMDIKITVNVLLLVPCCIYCIYIMYSSHYLIISHAYADVLYIQKRCILLLIFSCTAIGLGSSSESLDTSSENVSRFVHVINTWETWKSIIFNKKTSLYEWLSFQSPGYLFTQGFPKVNKKWSSHLRIKGTHQRHHGSSVVAPGKTDGDSARWSSHILVPE